MRWFGESWGAPLNEDCEQTQTPVDFDCAGCGQAIAEGAQGVVLPQVWPGEIALTIDPRGVARKLDGVPVVIFHLDCLMVHVLGIR